jgi:hypothetical protein
LTALRWIGRVESGLVRPKAFLLPGNSIFVKIALTKAVTDPDPAVTKRAFDAMMTMGKIDIAAIEAAYRG